jgi:hypothetical protein
MSDEFMGTTNTQSAEVSVPATEAQAVKAESKAEYTEFLQAITNPEGKPKYKTVADALIGAAKAQEHIQRIETENAELRGVAKKVDTMEQLLQRLEQGKGSDQSPVPKIEDQEQMVLSVLEKRDHALRERQNKEQVLESLKGKFGDKVQDVLQAKANDLGLSVADLGALAARSPKAVLGYFDSRGAAPSVQSTVNTQALTPRQTEALAPDNIMWGASNKDVVGFFRQVKEEVNKEFGLA